MAFSACSSLIAASFTILLILICSFTSFSLLFVSVSFFNLSASTSAVFFLATSAKYFCLAASSLLAVVPLVSFLLPLANCANGPINSPTGPNNFVDGFKAIIKLGFCCKYFATNFNSLTIACPKSLLPIKPLKYSNSLDKYLTTNNAPLSASLSSNTAATAAGPTAVPTIVCKFSNVPVN